MVLDLQTLGAPFRNGGDAGAEHRTALGFLGATFTHLQKSRIDRLLLELVVDFFGALAFKDHCGKTDRTFPCGKVRDRGVAGKSEDVVPFLDSSRVIGKDLADEHARIPVVDAHRDFHFLQGQNGGIGLLLVARDEDSRIP